MSGDEELVGTDRSVCATEEEMLIASGEVDLVEKFAAIEASFE
jgi:hypothetical protein